MLLLTRRSHEAIKINDNITVTVLDIRGQHVKLGFNAPREVSIQREEIYQRIQLEGKKVKQNSEQTLDKLP